MLDLYAGTGALGIEALSRGAAWCDFVEVDEGLRRGIVENLRLLSLVEKSKVYRRRAERAVETLTGTYDLVFADPPYSMVDWDPLMGRLGRSDLVSEGGMAVVEHRYGTALAESYGALAQVSVRRYGDTAVSMYRAGGTDG